MDQRYLSWFLMALILGGISLLWSCKKNELIAKTVQGEEPRKTSFWYYKPNFHLNPNETELRTDGIYFRIVDTDSYGETYKALRFYPDGLVIAHIAYSTPDKITALERLTQGNIHGYYQLKQDSLMFTTKVYYNHSPTFYSGEIYKDSILLHSINYKTRESDSNIYYFYKEKRQ